MVKRKDKACAQGPVKIELPDRAEICREGRMQKGLGSLMGRKRLTANTPHKKRLGTN
jgi:hypothetical protein